MKNFLKKIFDWITDRKGFERLTRVENTLKNKERIKGIWYVKKLWKLCKKCGEKYYPQNRIVKYCSRCSK